MTNDSAYLCSSVSICGDYSASRFHEALEVIRQIGGRRALDLLRRHLPTCGSNIAEFVLHYLRDHRAAVLPLIKQLIQNSGVAVLGHETFAEHLDAHAGDLFDDGG